MYAIHVVRVAYYMTAMLGCCAAVLLLLELFNVGCDDPPLTSNGMVRMYVKKNCQFNGSPT